MLVLRGENANKNDCEPLESIKNIPGSPGGPTGPLSPGIPGNPLSPLNSGRDRISLILHEQVQGGGEKLSAPLGMH